MPAAYSTLSRKNTPDTLLSAVFAKGRRMNLFTIQKTSTESPDPALNRNRGVIPSSDKRQRVYSAALKTETVLRLERLI
jgi:hypothetical protein